ncbi:MAG: hypothetical protein PWP71_1473 [Clostridia bacterium]|jgi:hypothetical protein|nr:hypothetical protein [Clostridia bacterium]
MAKLIPDIDPRTIENSGERTFYEAASKLPEQYTLLYSFKYKDTEEAEDTQIKEADFIIVHPSLGYLVIEVKQGDIAYFEGSWQEFKKGGYHLLHKNPVDQAKNAMFAILERYKNAANKFFPLKMRYAVCFPECNKISGNLPEDLDEKSIFLYRDLEKLEDKIFDLFSAVEKKYEREAVDILLNKILAPSFKIFSRLEEKIEMHNQRAEKVLTEEQERILEETELDKRKIFFGGAGSGKTFLAMEKSKRLANQNKKVLLTCYNKNLANCMFAPLSPLIISKNFHEFLEEVLRENNIELNPPQTIDELRVYFDETLPTMAFDLFSTFNEEDKFDAILVDEGQDFKEDWLTCLESMLKEDGEFYIFADPNQSIFNKDIEKIQKIPVSKHRLTRNLRNTEEINKWMEKFVPSGHLRCQLQGGMPVNKFTWKTPQEEKKLIEQEIGRLVSQGVQLKRITILSPNKKEKSSLAGLEKLKEWPLVNVNVNHPNAIKFATIRSFKGLESDIVFLIGLRDDSLVCSDADIYVGGSRAKFLLYIFAEEGSKFI